MSDRQYPVKRGQQLTLQIEKLAFGGKGIAHLDDYVIFVQNVLPGDQVRAKIYKRKANYAEARPLELLKSSELRQEAPCPYFGWCGGCTWQNLSYKEQLKVKSEQVTESVHHIAGLHNVEVMESLPSPNVWGYRNKMEFSFSDRRWLLPEELGDENIKKDFALGLHIPGTFDKILDIDNCLLQAEPANQILNLVRDYCKEHQLSPYGIHSQEGFLRFLVIRRSQANGSIMVNIVTGEKKPKVLIPLAELLKENVPEIAGMVNTINRQKAQVATGEEEILLLGQSKINDTIGGYSFDISANSFFQTNTLQAERLYQVVLDFAQLEGDEIVWDLYAGTGTISLFLAGKTKVVYAFEIVDSAVRDGIKNAKRYNVENIHFISGDLLHNLNQVQTLPDTIVIDPPRSGMHPKVSKFLSEGPAQRIVYVSCNPTTLARDLEILKLNYHVIKIQPVDMFPHTYHIEAVTLLERR